MDPHKIKNARLQRKDPTPTEQRFWFYLRDRRFAGFKFRRQQPIGPYIVDFYCSAAEIVVELDGESHVGKEVYDEQRRNWLKAHGYKVMTFWDTHVYSDATKIFELIYEECKARASAGKNALPLTPRSLRSRRPSPSRGEGM